MIIVDPPSVFFGLWKLVHPLLPEKTARKVRHPAGHLQGCVRQTPVSPTVCLCR